MAFGLKRDELNRWKERVASGEIAFLTHYWHDPRFPDARTVTKVGCCDLSKLSGWCERNGLNPRYIHDRALFPHFDLVGPKQVEILTREKQWDQLRRFRL
ncbi:hypothetical protein [Paenibacillus beijingensis]|uniref:YneQ n=1 Tax=Paenibacillus beijingensis TaxID=1126833 RepID=A0A0D5NDX2_9BACL|nr:hypothetical protein [Paenibacillus beijingensis]AJY73350.1 hypothetical protein VN24_00300 [Paenibacillus beijingensis]